MNREALETLNLNKFIIFIYSYAMHANWKYTVLDKCLRSLIHFLNYRINIELNKNDFIFAFILRLKFKPDSI
jgi:outer membrane lipoprotein-sorting protein